MNADTPDNERSRSPSVRVKLPNFVLDGRITTGSLITSALLLVGIVANYYQVRSDLSAQELKRETLEKSLAEYKLDQEKKLGEIRENAFRRMTELNEGTTRAFSSQTAELARRIAEIVVAAERRDEQAARREEVAVRRVEEIKNEISALSRSWGVAPGPRK